MKNKNIIIFSVILAIIIAVGSVFIYRYTDIKRAEGGDASSTSTTATTENFTENTTENLTENNIAESTIENITEETNKVTEKTTEETTTKKVEATTKKVETTTQKAETTTQKPTTTKKVTTTAKTMDTIFSANLSNSPPTALETALFNAVNEEREKAGVKKLIWNDNIHFLARKRAEEAIITGNHSRPDGTGFGTIFEEYGISTTRRAENLIYGYSDRPTIVDDYIEGWLNSPSHKKAMLSSKYKYAAIGVAVNSAGKIYAVNLFVG